MLRILLQITNVQSRANYPGREPEVLSPAGKVKTKIVAGAKLSENLGPIPSANPRRQAHMNSARNAGRFAGLLSIAVGTIMCELKAVGMIV
jgi:hypothetical protein